MVLIFFFFFFTYFPHTCSSAATGRSALLGSLETEIKSETEEGTPAKLVKTFDNFTVRFSARGGK